MRNTPGLPGARAAAAALLVGCYAAAAPAHAADATDARATELETQVRGWLADMVGPRAGLAERPVRITADGDHYRVEIPVGSPDGGAGSDSPPITAIAKPMDGGRWALDPITFPSPVHYSLKMGADTTTMTYAADEQSQHAVLDPSLATASIWDMSFKGFSSHTIGPNSDGSSRFATLSSHMAWQPAGDGRINALQEFDGSLMAVNSMAPKVGMVSVSAERVHGSAHLDNLSVERVPPILQALFELGPRAMAAAEAAQEASKAGAARSAKQANKQPPGAPKQGKQADAGKAKTAPPHAELFKMTAGDHTSLHAALVALRDLTGGFGETATLENVHVDVGGHGAHFDRFTTGMDMHAPAGLLAVRFNVGLDGFDSPDIPAGVMRDYLPRHIAIAPRFGGVPAKELVDLLIRAADSDGNDPGLQAEAEALVGKGPMAVGLDELALDFGPATLKGSGELRILDRDTYDGHAHLAATGLDTLIHQANENPELQQAAPFLLMLKGLGKQDGDEMVWNVTYRDGKMMVNGNDMSQMMPGK